MTSTTYTAHSVSTGVFAARTLIASGLSEDQAVDMAARNTHQAPTLIEDALACGPTGNTDGAHRIPANSYHGAAVCIDLTPEQ